MRRRLDGTVFAVVVATSTAVDTLPSHCCSEDRKVKPTVHRNHPNEGFMAIVPKDFVFAGAGSFSRLSAMVKKWQYSTVTLSIVL